MQIGLIWDGLELSLDLIDFVRQLLSSLKCWIGLIGVVCGDGVSSFVINVIELPEVVFKVLFVG
jgi:hypothetical protein